MDIADSRFVLFTCLLGVTLSQRFGLVLTTLVFVSCLSEYNNFKSRNELINIITSQEVFCGKVKTCVFCLWGCTGPP